MTFQETESYLYTVRNYSKEVAIIQAKIEALKSCLLPKAVTYDGDAVQTSKEDTTLRILAEVDELERELLLKLGGKMDAIMQLCDDINKLGNTTERAVLTCYFVNCMSMDKTAEKVPCGKGTVWRAKQRGIERLSKLI